MLALNAYLTANARRQKLSEDMTRIVFEHDGDIVTCATGKQIEIETPQRARRGKIDPYAAPLRHFAAARIVAIKELDTMYHVFWDPSSDFTGWANRITVSKRHTIHVE